MIISWQNKIIGLTNGAKRYKTIAAKTLLGLFERIIKSEQERAVGESRN